MTDHIFGEDSYMECDRFNVVSVTPYENFDPEFRPEHVCYCGKPTVQIARVGFHTVVEERDQWWDRTLSQNVKVHRCEEHKFEEEDR